MIPLTISGFFQFSQLVVASAPSAQLDVMRVCRSGQRLCDKIIRRIRACHHCCASATFRFFYVVTFPLDLLSMRLFAGFLYFVFFSCETKKSRHLVWRTKVADLPRRSVHHFCSLLCFIVCVFLSGSIKKAISGLTWTANSNCKCW